MRVSPYNENESVILIYLHIDSSVRNIVIDSFSEVGLQPTVPRNFCLGSGDDNIASLIVSLLRANSVLVLEALKMILSRKKIEIEVVQSGTADNPETVTKIKVSRPEDLEACGVIVEKICAIHAKSVNTTASNDH
ncbi:hypothetical protein ACU48Q_005390, partial [Escherichia coli]